MSIEPQARPVEPRNIERWLPRWLVVLGVIVAALAEAFALFAGEYVPYIDWSNHLGLISILAHGESMGSLEFTERSLAPRPYLLFYGVSAVLAQVVSVPAAAKLAFVGAAGLCVAAMAMLLRALGRPVVAALLAPLALYGYARGYGFSSFVFTIPLVLLVLATYERLIAGLAAQSASDRQLGPAIAFGGALLLCYLGHALQALPVGVAVALRFVAFTIGRPWRIGLRAFALTALATVPALICAVIAWSDLGPEREDVTLGKAGASMFLWGASLAGRWAGLGGHMLERGSTAHWTTMYGVAALFVILVSAQLFDAIRTRFGPSPARWSFTEGDRGSLVYGLFFASLYVVGPESVGWPQSVWMVYPRYATLGALALFLWPRPKLGSVAQTALGAVALALVLHNANLNRGHVARFSAWAQRYDPVRAAVPPKSTVLALTGYERGDWVASMHALGSLYFYHLCDGAAYTAFLFDNPMHPVRMKPDRPQAPPWNNVGVYSPLTHGAAFDYLVLRGQRFIGPTERAGRHDVVLRHEGWVVFRTKRP